MPFDAFILAEFDENAVKVLIGVIIAVLWGIGALANMAKKQQQQSRDARGMQELEWAARAEAANARRNQAAAEALAWGQGNAPPPSPPPFRPQNQQAQRPRGPSVPPMRPRAQQQPRPTSPRNLPPLPPPLRQVPQPQRQQQRQPQARPRGPAVRGPAVTPPPRRTKQAERRPAPAAAEPVLEEITGYSEGPLRPGVTESEIGAGTAPASPARRLAAAAPTVRLTPQSLRRQFILTEILQPPLALREPREP